MTCLQSLLQSYPGNILKHRNEPLLYFTSILQLCDVGMIEMSGGQCFIAIQSVSRPLHPFAAERQLNGNLLLEHTVSPQIHQAGTAAPRILVNSTASGLPDPVSSGAWHGTGHAPLHSGGKLFTEEGKSGDQLFAGDWEWGREACLQFNAGEYQSHVDAHRLRSQHRRISFHQLRL